MHFVRDIVGKNKIEVRYIHTTHQVADILTKTFNCGHFQRLQDKFHVLPRILLFKEGERMLEVSTYASLAEQAAYLVVFSRPEG